MVSSEMVAVSNNLDTPAKLVPLLLNVYMEVFRHLLNNTIVARMGRVDWIDRTNTEDFPVREQDQNPGHCDSPNYHRRQGHGYGL